MCEVQKNHPKSPVLDVFNLTHTYMIREMGPLPIHTCFYRNGYPLSQHIYDVCSGSMSPTVHVNHINA